jgi:DNA mismatch repair ATPase MutS
MDFHEFSLIYPHEESRKQHELGNKVPDIDLFTLQELGLTEALSLKSCDISSFFTTDPQVILYRIATFDDMMRCNELTEMLNRLVPILNDIMELRRLETTQGDADDYLSSITEIELYVSSIETLHSSLTKINTELKSPAFRALSELISKLAESDYYRELNEKLKELTQRVREIKSVTVGVNLDAQLRPASAGVLSINAESFKSGDVLDKILRLNFKNDEYTCIANLVPFGKKQSENQKTALSNAFNSAINDVYKASLRSWKKIVQTYVLENTEFLLNLMPEFEFLVRGTQMLNRLKEKGCSLTLPDIRPMEERAFSAIGLYNPCVALKIDYDIVANDVCFDENAAIYVLTGPNRGGKSVITCAVGLAQVMLQLGMYIPAEHATISPVDGIYTHFPTGAEDTIDKGRLGEECARLGEIFDCVTPNSLVLLDESLSSTGSYEASYIAAEVISGFAHIGCRCLFSTHLHELASEIENLNRKSLASGGVAIDTLVAGMEEEGKRSFRIIRAKPDGKSYARDIASSYGLTYDKILERLSH